MYAENKLQTLKGDECDGCSKKTPLYITRLVMFFCSRRFDVTCSTQPSFQVL